MTNLSGFQSNSRFLLAETIWLECEQVEQAKAISNHANAELASEARRWQHYLNALGLIGFEEWLKERLAGRLIERSPNSSQLSEFVSYLQVDEFILCLITVEHILDETVKIPQSVVEEPTQTAHFYVVSEVSEEQELVTIRGFLRFDELIQYRDRHHLYPQDGYYQFPLAALDVEPNHLLLYCQFLEPSAIALPVHSASTTADQSFVATLAETTTRLTQWFQNTIDESWQAIDQLINPEVYLSFSTRNVASGVKRGKLINLGLQLGQQTVALLMSVTPEADGKLGVLVQLHPTGTVQYLTPELKLVLRSPKGQTLQEVFSRSQDNYIQLKPFKGKAGTRFSVAIYSGGEIAAEESFEL